MVDAQQRLFILRANRSFYAMRVLADGALVHVGFGPAPTLPDAFSALDNYEEPNYVWEAQARRWEYPTFGNVTQHDVALRAEVPQAPGALQGGENYCLLNLLPDATYRMTDEGDHELGRLFGAQLVTPGMPGDQRHGHFTCSLRSRTVLMCRVRTGLMQTRSRFFRQGEFFGFHGGNGVGAII